MKHFFILNPAAGKGKAIKKVIEDIHAVCKARGVDYVLHTTERIGEATEFVKKQCKSIAEKVRFYACGGDGTINETASGMVGYENAELAVIPMGTGNDFARNFSNNERFFDIEAQLDGSCEKIDLLRYNDRYAVNMVNIGFDCEVVKQVAKNRRRVPIPAKAAYILGVVQKFIAMPGVKAKVKIDGVEQDWKEFRLCAMANGRYYGGGFCAAPLSDLRDGTVDICMVSPVSRMTFLGLIGSYKKGMHLEKIKDENILRYKKCSLVELTFDEPTDVCVDGELNTMTSLSVSTVKEAINFSIPRGCEMLHPSGFEEKQLVEV